MNEDEHPMCEATINRMPCGLHAVGLFLSSCVHEHVEQHWMCRSHANSDWRCVRCEDSSDPHPCRAMITPAPAGASK